MGGRCSRISGGTPEARSRLCICRASFFITFVTSGMSLAGSRQCPGIGFLYRADREIGVIRHVAPPTWLVSNFLVRPASSSGAPGRPGTPSRQRRGIYSPVVIRRGEGAQRKRCRDPRCSPRGNPACRGTCRGRMKGVRYHFALQDGTWDFP